MSVVRLWPAWSHVGDAVGCALCPVNPGPGTVRKYIEHHWHAWNAFQGACCYLRSQKRSKFNNKRVYESSRKESQWIFVRLCCLCRIPLIQFKSIKKQLKEKGELEEFWRNHHPDIFARRYLHCFPADIALSIGTASERLYDYMNVSTVLVMQS